jgi:hypothetical protein
MSFLNFRAAVRAACTTLIVAAVACDRAPTSPAAAPVRDVPSLARDVNGVEREVREQLSDFTDAIVAYPCGDGYTEQIRLEGQVFTRFTVTRDASGGLHSLTQSMPVGLRGIGLSSGAEYNVTEREHGTFNQGAMGQTSSTYKSFLNVHAPSLHVRGRLVLGGTFVVNANGELVFERPVLRADCQE